MEINKYFCTYKQSLDLKKLEFDEECLGLFVRDESLLLKQMPNQQECELYFGGILAPTFSQAFRWFREKYGLDSTIALVANGYGFYIHKNKNYTNKGESYGVSGNTYEEAELACLIKLIEIVKQ